MDNTEHQLASNATTPHHTITTSALVAVPLRSQAAPSTPAIMFVACFTLTWKISKTKNSNSFFRFRADYPHPNSHKSIQIQKPRLLLRRRHFCLDSFFFENKKRSIDLYSITVLSDTMKPFVILAPIKKTLKLKWHLNSNKQNWQKMDWTRLDAKNGHEKMH